MSDGNEGHTPATISGRAFAGTAAMAALAAAYPFPAAAQDTRDWMSVSAPAE